jgi:hypothetical protein
MSLRLKGNINRDGERIYHTEHQSSYARIRMDIVFDLNRSVIHT